MAGIVQVINGEGQFEQDSVQQFVDTNDLASCKTNYQVVAIMGPQSSGKSTLLNYVVRCFRARCRLPKCEGLREGMDCAVRPPECSLEQASR
jgi:hypothetical protein